MMTLWINRVDGSWWYWEQHAKYKFSLLSKMEIEDGSAVAEFEERHCRRRRRRRHLCQTIWHFTSEVTTKIMMQTIHFIVVVVVVVVLKTRMYERRF